MTVSFFTDEQRRDKVAEFYDTSYPTIFLRGLMEKSKEEERDVTYTIACRHAGDVSYDKKVFSKGVDVSDK